MPRYVYTQSPLTKYVNQMYQYAQSDLLEEFKDKRTPIHQYAL